MDMIYLLAVFSRLCQIIVDHAAAILLRFRYCCISTLFIAADLVLSIETFEDKLACSHYLCLVRFLDVKRNERSVNQLRHSLEQPCAFPCRRCICQSQIVSLVKPLHCLREVNSHKVVFKDFSDCAFDQV